MRRLACRLPSNEAGGRVESLAEELDAHLSSLVGLLVVTGRSVGRRGQTLAHASEVFGDGVPAKVPLSALCSDYGYAVGPDLATEALEAIGDKVDIPESRPAKGGTLRSYADEDIVEKFYFPEICETPPPC